METPTIHVELNQENNITFVNEFNLEFDNLKYLIKFGKSSNKEEELIIYIKEENILNSEYYQNYYTLQQLQKINKYFRVFDNIDETIENFKDIISEKRLIIKNINDVLYITVKINKIGKGEEEINLEFKKSKLGTDKIVDNLISQINNINLEINNLKNEINNLKNENKNLKEENNFIKEDVKITKEENKSLKEQIKSLKEENKAFIKNINDINCFLSIDSRIIKNKKELELISNRIKNKDNLNKNIKYQLIYRGSRDGMNTSSFHQKSNGISPTISIIKTTKGFKFGGYTEKTWENNSYGISMKDDKSFVFSLNYMKIYNHIQGKDAIVHNNCFGPSFYYCFYSYNKFNGNSNYTYDKNNCNNYYSGFERDYELTNGDYNFSIKEIEVFKVLFE